MIYFDIACYYTKLKITYLFSSSNSGTVLIDLLLWPKRHQYPIKARVLQGSVLALRLIYISDFPVACKSTTATFADDVAILSVNKDPGNASINIQNHFN